MLESLAAGNYFSARPHTIDAAVFFDVVRIRRLIDEATNLSVRAVNGTGLSALGASLNAGHGIRTGSGCGTIKLSSERRFRMRELAVKKLSEAYHLDEIAASVATMQSASSLEEVAKIVLQRSSGDTHAKYVHFFHEKISSRALVEITSLQPLSDILQDRPSDCAILRTRALTKMFKDDFVGASKDLTEAISILRREDLQHLAPKSLDLVREKALTSNMNKRESKHDVQKLSDGEKPTGLEAQLYFQRAGVYLSLACQSVDQALQYKSSSMKAIGSCDLTDPGNEHAEALDSYRKVKFNSRRALRDFSYFLSKLEYTPGVIRQANNNVISNTNDRSSRLSETAQLQSLRSEVLAPMSSGEDSVHSPNMSGSNSSALPIKIYPVSDLFSPTPPVCVPPLPSVSSDLAKLDLAEKSRHDRPTKAAEQSEIITYHPLLTEALHGLLLCHALLQTNTLRLTKHALMVARLVALSDGFPIFVSPRSASRADWVDLLEQTKSWLDMGLSWDQLCKGTDSNQKAKSTGRHSEILIKDCKKHETTSEETSNQVHKKKTLRAAAHVMEIQTDNIKTDGKLEKMETKTDLKAYSLRTERADIIARWVMEAPTLPDAPTKQKKNKKKATRVSSAAKQ